MRDRKCLPDKTVQTHLQAEIDRICGVQLPSFDHYDKLSYVEATILETMRLGNIVPITVTHRTLNGPKLFRGYNIPEDAEIIGNLKGAHMDPQLFPEPEMFKPHRFLDDDGCIINKDKVILFGMGE